MWLTFALFLFIFQIAIILVVEHRRPAKTVAWLVIVFLLPLLGFLAYGFIAREYRRRSKVRRWGRVAVRETKARVRAGAEVFPNPAMRTEKRLFGLLRSFPGAAMTTRNDLAVLSSAEEMFRRMLEDMEAARDHIHLVYYIWNDDGWGRTFRRTLVRKAREGVEVRIIYDGVGTYRTPQSFWDEIREAGGRVHCFLPVFFSLLDRRLNYRNHRKIAIVDGVAGYVGGINIGDEYTGKDRKLGYWRDTSVRLAGEAVPELQRTFAKDWEFVSGERLPAGERYFPRHEAAGRNTVQIVPSGPDSDWNEMLKMYFGAFVSAKERICMTTPYLIPDRSLTMALKTAALSGVDVRIVIPGVADSRLTMWASLSFVEELLRAGVRVYRYRKGFMHAKTIVVDRHFATTGTANMDLRSFFSNFEVNAAFFDEPVVARFAEDFMRDIGDSEEIRLEAFVRRGRLARVREAAGRLLAPLL